MAAKKKSLGRGLDALLKSKSAEKKEEASPVGNTPQPATESGQQKELPVEFLQRGKYQPRQDMSAESLEELASSIRLQGVLQPIIVRPVGPQKYEIIAGERRWRASQMAGLAKVPVIIREVPDDAAVAMALIENIQRENLNPIEEAMALHRLQQEFSLTQQEVAEAVGKSRSTVTNLLRLMGLKEDVRKMLEHGDIEMGHARAILGLPAHLQSLAAKTVAGKGLSVRQAEVLVRKMLEESAESKKAIPAVQKDRDIRVLEDNLSEKIGAPVEIRHGAKGKGKLVISYSSLDELDGILGHIR